MYILDDIYIYIYSTYVTYVTICTYIPEEMPKKTLELHPGNLNDDHVGHCGQVTTLCKDSRWISFLCSKSQMITSNRRQATDRNPSSLIPSWESQRIPEELW